MTIQPNSFEYSILWILTIILIIAKGCFILYLVNKVHIRKKETGKLQIDFLFSVLIVIIGLFFARILYFYFDFYLTEFDPEKYYLIPNIFYWKTATFIAQFSVALFLLIFDKKVLKFRLKGIIFIIALAVALFQLFYPVKTAEDFAIISGAGMLVNFVFILPMIIFIYLGIKTPRLRASTFTFVIGLVIYFIGSMILSEIIIAPLVASYGSSIRVVVFLISSILKIFGLILVIYGAAKFYI